MLLRRWRSRRRHRRLPSERYQPSLSASSRPSSAPSSRSAASRRAPPGRSSLEELRLLGAFADQAAIALEIGERAERASALPADELARMARLVSQVAVE